MKIAICGGSGFIGRHLSNFLSNEGHTVYILTRKKIDDFSTSNIQYVKWDANSNTFPFSSIDVVVNLAGESINNGRW
ncbi:NAD-dependent epimerase/dehydratase family protein, partial [Bacillus thuringiensis]|nr:NAD-dependent epimerase/dehydratase family protein [Bacillus thuringiensis]